MMQDKTGGHSMRQGMVRNVMMMAGASIALAACIEAPETEETLIRPVRYTEVLAGGALQQRIFSGAAKAPLEADISFKVPGNIMKIDVVVGDSVVAGQPVAKLDPTDYDVQVIEAEAGLQRAGAELRNAESIFERTRELYENRNVSKSDLDNARAGAESASAFVRAVQQQREAARLQRSYTELRAPQACTIASRYVQENQNVSAGQPIVRVNCGECVELVIDVPAAWIGRMAIGTEARVEIPALGKRQFKAIVSKVGVAADRGASTYPVTLVVREDCNDIRSGMAADVEFAMEGLQANGMTVPFVSVGEDRDGNYVFVLESVDGEIYKAVRRKIEIDALPTPAGIGVLSGLAEGELIVTAGLRRLTDGQIVTLLGE
jgi:multidrug efflux system membrane fusion protein